MERIISEVFNLLERFFVKISPEDRMELETILKRILSKKKNWRIYALIRIVRGMLMKEKLNLSIEDKVKEKAKILSAKTRISVSEIVELLINGTTEKEILKLYENKK